MSPMTEVAGSQVWIEVLVSVLLVLSGVLVLTGAFGLLRLKDFFQRMHPVALGTTLGTWSACAASKARCVPTRSWWPSSPSSRAASPN